MCFLMSDSLLYILVALCIVLMLLGSVAGYYVAANRAALRLSAVQTELERTKTALEACVQRRDDDALLLQNLQDHVQQAESMLAAERTSSARLEAALEAEHQLRVQVDEALQASREQLSLTQNKLMQMTEERRHFRTALEHVQQSRATEAERIKEMQEKHFAQFKTLAGELLEQNASKLKVANKENMDGLFEPLREQLNHLDKALRETNATSVGNKASLEAAIKAMMEKTECLSKDAENLALALKGDSKKQGDWGEMVLERMLEESGLRKGEEYYVQENFKTDTGANVRPDVVIRFPDKRCVVVDSKVSLTAYAQYVASEDDEARFAHLNAHVSSIRKHIDELAGKDYATVVEDTISYVLMFIPNEASYIAAVQAAPALPMEAYKRKIILISPTNLLMALQLAYNLWQKERQTRNVEAIFDRASKLYDKFASLKKSFEDMGSSLSKAQAAYDTGMNQLCRGSGHFAGQVQKLLDMGINPRNRLQLDDAEQ